MKQQQQQQQLQQQHKQHKQHKHKHNNRVPAGRRTLRNSPRSPHTAGSTLPVDTSEAATGPHCCILLLAALQLWLFLSLTCDISSLTLVVSNR